MSYLFYMLEPDAEPGKSSTLPAQYSFELWRPSRARVVPKGVPIVPFSAWWAMHHLRLFKNQDYGLLLIKEGPKLIHRSGVFPGYFRFPFMAQADLQIGDTWTAEEHRGKGLAAFAIQKIIEINRKPGRRFWYLTAESNLPSVRAIEKAGFMLIGEGRRSRRLGVKAIGSFVMEP